MPFCYSKDFIPVDINKYGETISTLYGIFLSEMKDHIFLNGKEVKFKDYIDPNYGKEYGFIHITHTDYQGDTLERYLDLERSKRIRLLKPIIENVNNCPNCPETDCGQILLWKEPFKKTERYYLFLVDEQYLVILESRPHYYLIISAFYVYPEQEEGFLNRFDSHRIEKI